MCLLLHKPEAQYLLKHSSKGVPYYATIMLICATVVSRVTRKTTGSKWSYRANIFLSSFRPSTFMICKLCTWVFIPLDTFSFFLNSRVFKDNRL